MRRKKPVEMKEDQKHGGNLRVLAEQSGLSAGRILDFSANINPLGPVPALAKTLSGAFRDIQHYPDPECIDLIDAVHNRYGWPGNRIVPGNGASELLDGLCRSLGCRRAVIPVPSYSEYAAAAERAGMSTVPVRMEAGDGFQVPWMELGRCLRKRDLVIIGNPNNPTGGYVEDRVLRDFIRRHPAVWFIVDESFIEFVPGSVSIADRLPRNAVMLRSMTKFYAVPGLRLGFAVARSEAAAGLKKQLPPWSVNCMAQLAGVVSLKDSSYAAQTQSFVERCRNELAAALKLCSELQVYDGRANFLLLRSLKPALDAGIVRCRLLCRGIGVRVCSNFAGLDSNYFRVAVRTQAENRRLVRELRNVLES